MRLNKARPLIILSIIICFFILDVFVAKADKSIEFYDDENYVSETDKALISEAYFNEVDSAWNTKLHIIVSSQIDLDYYRTQRNIVKNNILTDQFKISGFDPLDCFVIIINPEQKQSDVVFRNRDIKLGKAVFENINNLYLSENLKNTRYSVPYAQAIPYVIKDLIQAVRVQRELNNIKPVEVDTDNFSARFLFFLVVVLAVSIVYFICVYIKYRKPGHPHETQQFYALSRFPKVARKILSFIIGVVLLFLLYHYIYFFDEVIYAIFILLFAYIPITNFVLYIGFLVNDAIIIKKNFDSLDREEGVPLIPALLLLRPETTSFKLIESTLYSLILKEQLSLQIEWKQFSNERERKYVRIEKGPQYDLLNAKNYEIPLLEPFKNLEQEYGYYLHEYLGLIDNNLRGLKYFKKDLVSIHLIQNGLLSKKGWIFNLFKPNKKGEEVIVKLKKLESNIKGRLIGDKEALKEVVNQAKDKLLLVSDLRRFLKNKFDEEQVNNLLSLNNAKISFLLNEEFEDEAFDTAVSIFFKEKIYSEESEY